MSPSTIKDKLHECFQNFRKSLVKRGGNLKNWESGGTLLQSFLKTRHFIKISQLKMVYFT